MTKILSQILKLYTGGGLGVADNRRHCYRLAGCKLVADTAIGMLESFRINCPSAGGESAPVFENTGGGDQADRQWGGNNLLVHPTEFVARTSGWLANETREVVNTANEQGYSLSIAGVGEFGIDRLNGHIHCRNWNKGLPVALAEEATLGPPVTLALALRDIWCLHASAISREDHVSLFLGPSGHGKSTLAGYLNRHGGDNVGRVTDDISPCIKSIDGVIVLPHFPQPKLEEAQYSVEEPGCLALKSIFILERVEKAAEPRIEPVRPVQAMRELTNQTVAVSLFDRELHQRHLHFLAGLVKSAQVFKLHYPHDYGKLPQVTALLSEYL